MFDSVLRVYGENFDVDSFLASHALSVPLEIFRQGENDILGNPNPDSGFDALISENDDVAAHLDEVRIFFASNAEFLSKLKDDNITVVLDLGFTVGSDEQFAPSVKLPAQLLGLLHGFNISVEISAYPGSHQ